ncbi:MAG: flagellar hook-length control protein FliK [Lachnospiraceae bacterium]|nr:flagellar hook-length control protein FliK [Lachnospiraceae bacterium]
MNIADSGININNIRINQGQTAAQTGQVSEGQQTAPSGEVSGNAIISQATEGQAFNGTILNITNDKVSIMLDNNTTVNARMAEAVNMNIGDTLSFLVKENNGESVFIKPFNNDANLMKDNAIFNVLEHNNFSPSEKNYQIAESLMNNNMPVDKGSMQKIMQQSYKYPDAPIDTLVSLNKMGLPVNETSISQYNDYMSNNHQLYNDIRNINSSIMEFSTDTIMNMGSDNNISASNDTIMQVLDFNNTLLSALSDAEDMANIETDNLLVNNAGIESGETAGELNAQNLSDTPVNIGDTNKEVQLNESSENTNSFQILDNNGKIDTVLQNNTDSVNGMPDKTTSVAQTFVTDNSSNINELSSEKNETEKTAFTQQNISDTATTTSTVESNNNSSAYVPNNVSVAAEKMDINPNDLNNLVNDMKKLGLNDNIVKDVVDKSDTQLQLLNNINKAVTEQFKENPDAFNMNEIKQFFASENYNKVLSGGISKKLTLDTGEMKEPKEIDDLYKSMYEKTEKLMNAFSNSSSSTGKNMSNTAKSMQERIDFMQDINNMYAYAQIPFRTEGNEANSELFVYMNKKKMQEAKENVSALLHLDMKFLGPTDVHVSLHGNNVHTKFYVEDEESARIIDEHMTMLEKAIKETGHTLSNEVITREPALALPENMVTHEMFGDDMEKSVKRYSFDVRM